LFGFFDSVGALGRDIWPGELRHQNCAKGALLCVIVALLAQFYAAGKLCCTAVKCFFLNH
jgi:hypothetical protein